MWDYLLYGDNCEGDICHYASSNSVAIADYSPKNYLESTNVDFEIVINEFTVLYSIQKEYASFYKSIDISNRELLDDISIKNTTISLLSEYPPSTSEPELNCQNITKDPNSFMPTHRPYGIVEININIQG